MTDSSSINEIIATIEQIPTLPEVSSEIMTAIEDEESSIKEITLLIEQDMALATQILKVANSPFYGTLNRVSTIGHAIMILGLGEVKSLLLVCAVQNFFKNSEGDKQTRKRFWRHSVLCSQVTRLLARHFKCQANDTLFISGLIHDIGKIILDQYMHREFRMIMTFIEQNLVTFSQAEKEILGVTHYQIGAKLLQQWNFPKQVIMQVFYHHAPWQDHTYTDGSTIIYLADIFTKLAGFPCSEEEKTINLEQFSKSKAVHLLNKHGYELDMEIMEKILFQIKETINDAEAADSLFL